jgi:hypothetical protein
VGLHYSSYALVFTAAACRMQSFQEEETTCCGPVQCVASMPSSMSRPEKSMSDTVCPSWPLHHLCVNTRCKCVDPDPMEMQTAFCMLLCFVNSFVGLACLIVIGCHSTCLCLVTAAATVNGCHQAQRARAICNRSWAALCCKAGYRRMQRQGTNTATQQSQRR